MTKILMSLLLVGVAVCPSVHAQSFSSGSTGADGALDLTNGDLTVQLPYAGVLNYTTVNIPSGRSLHFKRNLQNSAIILLAQGAVNIGGTIFVSPQQTGVAADYVNPGPGGFFGGTAGQQGFGPGGGRQGSVATNRDGIWIGPLSLVPIVGGSGGAGCLASDCGVNLTGGGGGGAIVIASSTSINLTASSLVQASGQCGNFFTTYRGGNGSGGAIRLIANNLTVAGSLNANGCGGANNGVIRFEAPTGALVFSGSSTPAALVSTINPVVIPTTATSSLSIVSIGGFAVPAYTGSRPDTVDLLLPNQLPDPINVVVQGSNISPGTQVKVTIAGSGSSSAGTLSGTLASSTATLSVTGLNRSASTYLYVFTTFDVPQTGANDNPPGQDQVAQVRIESAPGSKSQFAFLRSDGTEVSRDRVPASLLERFEP